MKRLVFAIAVSGALASYAYDGDAPPKTPSDQRACPVYLTMYA